MGSMTVSEQDAPFIEPYALAGNPKGFKSKGNTAEAVKRALAHLGFMAWSDFDQHWNVTVNDAAAAWKRKRGLIPSGSNDGSWGEKSHDTMRTTWFLNDGVESPAFDGGCQRLLQEEKDGQEPEPDDVPDLGPVRSGGYSVLDQDLTHATSGINLYPAFDDGFSEGVSVLAPEDLEITKASSSNPGDACYAEGRSGLRYWFGHLVTAPEVGRTFAKGGKLGVTCHNDVGGGPHVHVGVNVEKFWGANQQLTHHTNYTHGAPLIGDQLAAGHPL